MGDRIFDINNDNRDILDIIRCKPGIEKTVLAKVLDMAFKTLANKLEFLEENGYIFTEPDLHINKKKFLMCGISVGGSHCKLVLTDANYEALSKAEFDTLCDTYDVFNQSFWVKKENTTSYGYKYFETPETQADLEKYLLKIINDIIKLYDLSLENHMLTPIISIGIAFTGSIDSERQVIIRSHNLKYMRNVSRDTILTPEILYALKMRKIEFIIDHNAKAMAVSEKFSLYHILCNPAPIASIMEPTSVHQPKALPTSYIATATATAIAMNGNNGANDSGSVL